MAIKVVEESLKNKIHSKKTGSKTTASPVPKEYIICCADSQSTALQNGSKVGNAQKLVRVGNNFVMGTGIAEWIHQCVSGLYSQFRAEDGPADLSKKLLDVSQQIQPSFKSENGLGFLVAGYHQNQLSIMQVDALNPEGKRGVYPVSFMAVMGSGGRFASPAVMRDFDIGVRVMPKDLAEGFLFTYDLAETASRDLGVNDRYQFGLICPSGETHELFHPEVRVNASPGYFHGYIREVWGVNPPWAVGEYPDRKTVSDARAIADLSWGFYNTFLNSLARFHGMDCWANITASKLKSGEESISGLKEMLQSRNDQKQIVMRVIDAWTSRSFEKLNAVMLEHQSRMNESYDRLKSLYAIQHQ